LTATFGGDNQKNRRNYDESMFQVPGFMENIRYLVAASVAAGVFSGLRGSIFTIVGGRVNVRLRTHLMDSLLSQDIGFFDVTKTGEITSRLSSDTTLVGDQVALNVNVFLRSLVQAIGVLLFMFLCSWQLSILAFLSVPIITMLSRWYGQYLRKLTKLMQKKLADGNSVSEAALGSMATVRAFDAAEAELQDFESHMANYLRLNDRCAIMYFGYAAMTTAVPELIFAIVVFYGGMLVRNGDLTGGELVSFLLYLQSLSDAFSTIGYVFSSLTQAVGAADKVFELMHRKPKYKHPSTRGAAEEHTEPGVLGIEAKKVRLLRTTGQRLPATETSGRVQLDSVKFYYPARPQRCILDGLSLVVEPGSVVALVGKSGKPTLYNMKSFQ
jgi:ATP-binding cassette, subfamily B (MDR/TAP), member 9